MQFNNSFSHKGTKEEAINRLKLGLTKAINDYPQYINNNPQWSNNNVIVNGKHFNITITVDDHNVTIKGNEDLAGHIVHGKVLTLIEKMFE